MSMESVRANLKLHGIDYKIISGSVQRFQWPKTRNMVVNIWVACQHPLSEELCGSLLPFMDVCVCWYHDHQALSCVKVRAALIFLEKYKDNIWLMSTTLPKVRIVHRSRVEKSYDRNGFLRQCLVDTMEKSIDIILRSLLQANNNF